MVSRYARWENMRLVRSILSRNLVCALYISIIFISYGCSGESLIGGIKNINNEPFSGEIITVMTFNIRVGAGREGDPQTNPLQLKASPKAIDRIVEAIKEVGPDFCALQEISGYGQADQLAQRLNMNFAYSPHNNHWGLAVLSKHKIEKVEHHQVDSRSLGRVGQVCIFRIRGTPVALLNLHTTPAHIPAGSDSDYGEQFNNIYKILSSIRHPVILAGDLNQKSSSPYIKKLEETLVNTSHMDLTKTSKASIFQYGPDRTQGFIDYIFVDPKSFVVQKYEVLVNYHDASDHLAHYAILKLK